MYAKALGPMQFTDRRGHGTYLFVVRSCRGAQLDPNFERGSTRLSNAMKAAVCLLDIELSQMNSEIRVPIALIPMCSASFQSLHTMAVRAPSPSFIGRSTT
jgi:hypothetical protein